MILLQTKEIIDKSLEINPWNAGAFGVLVAVLVLAVWVLWRELAKEQLYSKQISEKVIELMTRIDLGLDADKEVKKILISEWPQLKSSIQALRDIIHQKLTK